MERHYNYIIIGSGLAGLYTALEASRSGSVALLTKSGLTESNSYHAQGGIAAVTDKDDIPQYHFDDTITAGRGLCDEPAVRILVNEGPSRINEIIGMGMKFDITESGELALGLEGGHHRRRILHAGGDATGRMITSFVLEQVKKSSNIDIFSDCMLVSLLTEGNRCDGARCWNTDRDEEEIFTADTTILASGGSSAIYRRTTNPSTTTGDGVAIAYDAGCEVEDIEFIQFHPTAIYIPGGESFLVSEAVRGEGARLYNLAGERFMVGAHELAELAPRDVVAQKIDQQIRKEGKGYVYLSLKHLDPQYIIKRFPTIYAKCKELGIDFTDRIPIAPAAHYTVGGIRTDEYGRTGIENLYICGELASTGIMGANRLASNSLIECLVFGKRAVSDSLKNKGRNQFGKYAPKLFIDKSLEQLYLDTANRIASIVTECAGIVRNADLLKKGLADLENIKRETESITGSKEGYADEIYSNRIRHLITTATLIMNGALFREESRGCHFRSDYPCEREEFHCHTIQKKGSAISKTEVSAE